MFNYSPNEGNAHYSEISLLTYPTCKQPKQQDRLWENRHSAILLVRMQDGSTPIKGNLEIPNKT